MSRPEVNALWMVISALMESAEWKRIKDLEGEQQIPSLQNNLLDWRVRLTDPLAGEQPDMDKWEKMKGEWHLLLLQY